jgi:AbrB family looped-hinge helix DNA binding protein
MAHKVGSNGQVVIPKWIRDRIGIEPGHEVTFQLDGEEVRIRRAAGDPAVRGREVKALRGAWTGSPGGGTDELLEERRKEREPEERKAQETGP